LFDIKAIPSYPFYWKQLARRERGTFLRGAEAPELESTTAVAAPASTAVVAAT